MISPEPTLMFLTYDILIIEYKYFYSYCCAFLLQNVAKTMLGLLTRSRTNVLGWSLLAKGDRGRVGDAHQLVNQIEGYLISQASAADLNFQDGYLPWFSAAASEFTYHLETEAATISVLKLFPARLQAYGPLGGYVKGTSATNSYSGINLDALFKKHPIHPTGQWAVVHAKVEIPPTISFKDPARCDPGGPNNPLTVLVAAYSAYHTMAPLNRNPRQAVGGPP